MAKRSLVSLGLPLNLIALGLGIASRVSAQQVFNETPDPTCTSQPDCRFVGAVTLRTDQGVVTPALNRNMRFLQTRNGSKRIWLVLGERVIIDLGAGADSITVAGHGLAGDPPMSKAELQGKIEIDLQQAPDSTQTNMVVRNGYNRQLEYKAFTINRNGEELPSSVCSVPSGIFSIENWPGPLIEIELGDFKLTDAPTTSISCRA